MKFAGAHVSIAGGVENAPLNAAAIGATAFAMFTKNQRQWNAAPITEASAAAFIMSASNAPQPLTPSLFCFKQGRQFGDYIARKKRNFTKFQGRCISRVSVDSYSL